MADKTEFLQAIDDAILDADSLERFINGDDTQDVLTRLSAEYPTLQKAIKELFENGGIAGRFKTLTELQASPLADGSYALVADDTNEKNGIYIKEGGVWRLSGWSGAMKSGGAIAVFLSFLINLIDMSYRLVGTASTASDVNNAKTNQAFLITKTGEYAGIRVALGQVLVKTETSWRVIDKAELLPHIINNDSSHTVVLCTQNDLRIPTAIFTNEGDVVSSTYSSTGYIKIEPSTEVFWDTQARGASLIVAFYDEAFNLIGGVNSMGVSPAIAPPTAFYFRSSSLKNPESETKFKISITTPKRGLAISDLQLNQTDNLAGSQYIVRGEFIGSDANAVYKAAGWVSYRIPVKANSVVTFGNFHIASSGYYAFVDDNNSILKHGGTTGHKGLTPVTATAPSQDCYIMIDVARPSDPESAWSEVMVNYGSNLKPYVEPGGKIEKINGIELIGSGQNIVTSTDVFVANLPTNSEGLATGQAWIDTATGTIKVKL